MDRSSRVILAAVSLLVLAPLGSGCRKTTTAGPSSGAPQPAPSETANFTLTFPRPPSPTARRAEREAARPHPVELDSSVPDPDPVASAEQWQYELEYDRGEVRVVSVEARRFERPVATARRVGRYAIELWIGRELVERVRFEFPLIGAEEVPPDGKRPLRAPPSLLPGAQVRRVVLVPNTERARRAVLVDRATGRAVDLPWPPTPGAQSSLPAAQSAAPAASQAPATPAGSAAPSAVPAAGLPANKP
jgi:hypothetical protein